MFPYWPNYPTCLLELEQQGKITRTFRRLDPERQRLILDAILIEAAEKGPAALNIKAVAKRAGVAIGSLYQYFPDRDAMLDFAIELCVRYLHEIFTLSQPYLLAMPLAEALSSYLSVGIEWGQTEVGLVRFFGRAAYQGDPDLAERLVRPIATVMRELMYALLVQAAARGEIRTDVDIETAARLVNLLMIAFGDSQLFPYLNTYFQVNDETISTERVGAALVPFILAGIGKEKVSADTPDITDK
jgi:AcrR family transcriptional regulator